MEENFKNQIKGLGRWLMVLGVLLVVLVFGLFFIKNNPEVLESEKPYEEILPTVELDLETIRQSGFVNDDGVSQVIQNCTQCHSAKLVTQNRMSEEGWEATILWMQETQNLWDLGSNQEKIVSYLAKNYGPQRKGRRQNLTNFEWYELE